MAKIFQPNNIAALVLADLAAQVGDYDNQAVQVCGSVAPGDGLSEGSYYWDADGTQTADGVTNINPANNTTGRWRLFGNIVTLTVRIADVSTADNEYIVSPVKGRIVSVKSALKNAITVADSLLTTAIAPVGGGAFVAITGGNWTVAFTGSAAGDVDSATPTALNNVDVGSCLRVTTDGGSTTTAPLTVTFMIKAV